MKDLKNISFIIRNTSILVLVFWSTYLSGQSIQNGDSTSKWSGDLEAFVVSLDNSTKSKAINTSYSIKSLNAYISVRDETSVDTIAPSILSQQIIDSVSIALKFDKILDTTTSSLLGNYLLNLGYGSPSEVWVQDSIVKLSFADSLITNTYELNVADLKDSLGNLMSDTTILFYYEAPEYIEPEPSWVKLKTDLVDDFIVIDSFENTLNLWQGEVDKFHNPNRMVMNTDSSTSPSFVFLPNRNIKNRLWEAGVEIEGAITTQNNIRIYLAASQDSLPGNQKGYYLQLDGGSGKHQYKLYKQNNSSRTLLFQSESYETNPASLRTRIRVTNSINGEWKIYTSENDHEAFTLLETSNGDTSVIDATFDNSLFSGWMTRFSSTRSQDYRLHYFLIKQLEELPDEPIDTIPPAILSHQIVDSVSIELTFNKALDTTSSLLSNYLLNPEYGAPNQVWVQDSIVKLSFADSLITNTYELNIADLKDSLGNLMSDTTILFYYEAPQYIDPEPSWFKLKTDLTADFIVIDSFENTLNLWQGEVDQFHNPNRMVMNKDSSTSPSFIFLPNRKIKNQLWEAGVEIEGAITTQNNIRIYLAASQDSLPGNQKGYYLQLDGGSGKHQYKLYKQNNSSRTLLFRTESYATNPISLRTRIRVTNSIDGEWKIYASENDHEMFTLLETSNGDTSVVDATFDNALYSGWMTRFSSTRSQDYRLHYFLIKELEELPDEPIDTIPPVILSHQIVDSVSIELKFDKVLDTITAGILSSYILTPGYGNPGQVSIQDSIVKLSFADLLITNTYELNIADLKDSLGNLMSDTTILFYYEALEVSEPIYNPLPYEVIINEIMADPKNSNGLPEIEYVELKNLTDKVIYLKDWTYQRPQTVYTFQDEKILPYSYLVLYKESDSLHVANFGASAGLRTWPILVNSGALLTLKNREGIIIDQVDYSSAWYGDTHKAKGGWSLERITDYNLCMDRENWKASTDPSGGTPGRENSIHQVNSILDLDITSAQIIDVGKIKVIFNKSIAADTAKLISNYSINNSMGIPDSITIIDSKSLVLNYSSDFLPDLYYQLTINNIADCVGSETTLQVEIFSAEDIEKNDLLINEVLMNPYKDGVEFVEIYNNSMKKLDLTTLSLATIRSSDNKYTTKTITKEAYILDPQKYLLLSNNSAVVAAHYPSSKVENFLEMESFPVLNNTTGTIVLLSKDKEIDRFDYHESMHDPLVVNKKGISLERVNFQTETNAPKNFKSAAATVGYATPGYENSQLNNLLPQENEISLSSKTFSPDNDGFEDLLEINYSFNEATEDVMATVQIYKDNGLLIRKLYNNKRLSRKGTLHWDGMQENNQQAKVGIYIIAIQLYNSKGFNKIIRKSCVLASKF